MCPPPSDTAGAIRGTVTDSDGAMIPGVEVSAVIQSPPGMPSPRPTHTDAAGQYRLLEIPPGCYEVTASLPGFVTQEKPVFVELGRASELSFTMAVEPVHE